LELDNLDAADQAFLKGCLIGDGWLGLQRRQYVHLRIGHCEAQLPWLQWKAERLNRILRRDRRILGPYVQGDGSSSGKKHISYLYSVDDHQLFKPWYDRWYEHDGRRSRKKIDKAYLNGLDMQALAILWCDDGSIYSSNRVKKHRCKDGSIHEYPYVEARGTIALCSFTDHENQLIADWIYSLTGVRFSHYSSKGYPLLGIGKQALKEFIPQVDPYIPDCMKRKADLSHCRVR